MSRPMWTPLLRSQPFSDIVGKEVFLKVESVQPSGSFKDRGISRLCTQLVHRSVAAGTRDSLRLAASSGGNAGLSVALWSRRLGVPACIFVPLSTPQATVQRIRAVGGGMVDVVVAGNHWNECDAKCRAFVEENPGAEYVPPYEHEEIFEGHSSLVEEVSVQLEELGLDTRAPTAWVASVGGGGLISGVMRGLEKLGLESCARLVGVETRGCHSWSLKMRQKAPRLEEIASAAKSLGALEVCEDSVRWRGLRDWRSVVVEDREAARGSIALVDHHRLLTELACGCAVRTVADCAVDGIEVFGPGGPIEAVDLKVLWEGVDRVVVVVCGGNSVDLDAVMRWKSEIPGANS